jgi:hypothetical protein
MRGGVDSGQRMTATQSQTAWMWKPITTAPFERDLELAVIDEEGVHSLVFPCRRAPAGWINSQNGSRVPVDPTHWQVWPEQKDSVRAR